MTFLVEIVSSALLITSAFAALNIEFTDESTDASLGDIPHIVSLRSNNKHFCSGSLIHEEWVLTSAQCVANLRREDIQVVAGVVKFDQGGQRETVKQIVTHENYQPPFDNNIALVQLDHPFDLDENVKPIYVKSDKTVAGTQVVASGWNNTSSEDNLQKVYLKTLSEESCVARVHEPYPKEKVCVQDASNFCLNELGGPLFDFNLWALVGVASSASSCGHGDPYMYTDVTAYLNWIQMNTNGDVTFVHSIKNKLLDRGDLMDLDVLDENGNLIEFEVEEELNEDGNKGDDFNIKTLPEDV